MALAGSCRSILNYNMKQQQQQQRNPYLYWVDRKLDSTRLLERLEQPGTLFRRNAWIARRTRTCGLRDAGLRPPTLFQDHYAVHGLSKGTDKSEIKSAYWSSARPNDPAAYEKTSRNLIARSSKQWENAPQLDNLPLWLWILISLQRLMREALEFLREQPGQLQYIEWPSLQSTAKMAVLTVIVVVFLIIFLATSDSTFSFVLASILRRTR